MFLALVSLFSSDAMKNNEKDLYEAGFVGIGLLLEGSGKVHSSKAAKKRGCELCLFPPKK